MAITHQGQGAGEATETSGAELSPNCPATVLAGEILLGFVFFEGQTNTPDTPSGWTLLDGPRNVETVARMWVFGRVADGTEDGSAVVFGTQATTNQRAARIFSLTGRVSGAIDEVVRGFAFLSHATDPQMPTVTTTKAGSLAVAFVGQNDNNSQASATGETGGDWVETVGEFLFAGTPGLAIGYQTATPTADPGTISGGSIATANDPCGVIGFEVADSPADPTETGTLVAAVVFAGLEETVAPPTAVRDRRADFLMVGPAGLRKMRAVPLLEAPVTEISETGTLVAAVALDDVEQVSEPGAFLVAANVLAGSEAVAETGELAATVVLAGDEFAAAADTGTLTAAVLLDGGVEQVAETATLAAAVVHAGDEAVAEAGTLIAAVVFAGLEESLAEVVLPRDRRGEWFRYFGPGSHFRRKRPPVPLEVVTQVAEAGTLAAAVLLDGGVEQVSEPGGFHPAVVVHDDVEAVADSGTNTAVVVLDDSEAVAESTALVAVVVLSGDEATESDILETGTLTAAVSLDDVEMLVESGGAHLAVVVFDHSAAAVETAALVAVAALSGVETVGNDGTLTAASIVATSDEKLAEPGTQIAVVVLSGVEPLVVGFVGTATVRSRSPTAAVRSRSPTVTVTSRPAGRSTIGS